MVDLTSVEKEIFAQHRLKHADSRMMHFSLSFSLAQILLILERRRWLEASGFVCVYGCVCVYGGLWACAVAVWVCANIEKEEMAHHCFGDMKKTCVFRDGTMCGLGG